MHDLFTIGIPVAEKVLRTIAVYLGIALLLRLAGKRNLAQLNSFDLVVVLLLSSAVQNALIGADNSLTGGLVGAGVLVTVNSAVVRLVNRSERAVRAFEGTSVTLVKDGRFVDDTLRREGIRRADVEAALREQNADGPQDVAEATLSPGGKIVVWLKPEEMAATRADVAQLSNQLQALGRRLDVQHAAPQHPSDQVPLPPSAVCLTSGPPEALNDERPNPVTERAAARLRIRR